jgi:hypothetical protein
MLLEEGSNPQSIEFPTHTANSKQQAENSSVHVVHKIPPPVTLLPLTCITAVVRLVHPELQALSHVMTQLSDLLECAKWSIPRTVQRHGVFSFFATVVADDLAVEPVACARVAQYRPLPQGVAVPEGA